MPEETMGKAKKGQKHTVQKTMKKKVPPIGDKEETEVKQVQNSANNVWLKDESASAANVLFPDAMDNIPNEDADTDIQVALLLSLTTAEEEGYESPTKSEVNKVKPDGYKVIDDDGDDLWEDRKGNLPLKTEDQKLKISCEEKIQRKKNLTRETLGDFNKRLLLNPGSSKMKENEEISQKPKEKTSTVDEEEDFSFVKPVLVVKKKKGLQVIEEEDGAITEEEKTSLKGDVKKVSFADDEPVSEQKTEVKVSDDVPEDSAIPTPKDLEEKVVEEISVSEKIENEENNLEIQNRELEEEIVQGPVPEEKVQDELSTSEVEIQDEIPTSEVEIQDEIPTSEVVIQVEVATPDEKVSTILKVSNLEDQLQVKNSGLEVQESVPETKVEVQEEVSASEDSDFEDTSTIQNSDKTPVGTDDENSDTDTLKDENEFSSVEEKVSDSKLDDTVPLSDFQEMTENPDEISADTNEKENCEIIEIQLGGISPKEFIQHFAEPSSDFVLDEKTEPESVQKEEKTEEDQKPEPVHEENVKEETPPKVEEVPETVKRESRIPTRKRPICRDQNAEEENSHRDNMQQIKNPFGFKNNNNKPSTMFPKDNQKHSTMFPKDNQKHSTMFPKDNRREFRRDFNDSRDSRQNYREPGGNFRDSRPVQNKDFQQGREPRGNYRDSRQSKDNDFREPKGNYRDSRPSRDNDYKEPRDSRPSREYDSKDNYRDSRQSRDTEPRESRANYRDSRPARDSDQKVWENQGQYQRQGGDFRESRGNNRDSRGFSRGPRDRWAPSNNRGRQDERTGKSQEGKKEADFQGQKVSKIEEPSSSEPGEFGQNSQPRKESLDSRGPYREASTEDYQMAPNVGHKMPPVYRHPGEYYPPSPAHYYAPHYPPYQPYAPGYHPENVYPSEGGYPAQGYPYEGQEYPRPPLGQQRDAKSYSRPNLEAVNRYQPSQGKEQGYYPKQSLMGSPPRQQAGYYQRAQNQKYGERRGERRSGERQGYGDREMMGGCEERPLISPKTLMTTHIEAPPLQIHDREPNPGQANRNNNSRVCGGRGRGYSATKVPFPRKHNN